MWKSFPGSGELNSTRKNFANFECSRPSVFGLEVGAGRLGKKVSQLKSNGPSTESCLLRDMLSWSRVCVSGYKR